MNGCTCRKTNEAVLDGIFDGAAKETTKSDTSHLKGVTFSRFNTQTRQPPARLLSKGRSSTFGSKESSSLSPKTVHLLTESSPDSVDTGLVIPDVQTSLAARGSRTSVAECRCRREHRCALPIRFVGPR